MRTNMMATSVATALAVLGAACPASAATTPSPETKANVLDAMGDEAMAFAAYTAFADLATAGGEKRIASLWRTIASDTRDNHLVAQAEAIDLVGNTYANVKALVDQEDQEANRIYRDYTRQAIRDNDQPAAQLFVRLSTGSSAQWRVLNQTLHAVDGKRSYPTAPSVNPVTITPGAARSTGKTLDNLWNALKMEAFDSAVYFLYAKAAAQQNNAELARVLSRLSDTSRLDYFAALGNAAGLAGTTKQNLTLSLDWENQVTQKYLKYAKKAQAAKDFSLASLMTKYAHEEIEHADAFKAALKGM